MSFLNDSAGANTTLTGQFDMTSATTTANTLSTWNTNNTTWESLPPHIFKRLKDAINKEVDNWRDLSQIVITKQGQKPSVIRSFLSDPERFGINLIRIRAPTFASQRLRVDTLFE